jgi:hypothetical protein
MSASPLPRGPAAWLVAGVALAGVAVDGLLMLLVGPDAFLPATGLGAVLPGLLVLVGGFGSAVAFLRMGQGRASFLEATTPRLYPFAPLAVNVGIYVVILVGVVSIFHGFFDVFSSAHNGGSVGSILDQSDLFALLTGASAVVWILTVYSVLVIHRVIQLGRGLDAAANPRDVYGRESNAPPVRVRGSAHRADGQPASPATRWVVFGVTVLLGLCVSAGIQVLEVDIGPAPPLTWLAAQPFTLLFTLPLASALVWADRGLRDVERRALAQLSAEPAREPTPVPLE